MTKNYGDEDQKYGQLPTMVVIGQRNFKVDNGYHLVVSGKGGSSKGGFHDKKTSETLTTAAGFIENNEGRFEYPYLDTNGKITVGVGNNIDDKERFVKMAFKVDYKRATYEQKINGYLKLKSMEYGKNIPAISFKNATRLRQPGLEITQDLLVNTVNARNDALDFFGRGFLDYPQKVQVVLIDLSFQLGSGKLSKFVKLRNALNNQDFVTAAKEVHIKDTNDKGVTIKGLEQRNNDRESYLLQVANGDYDLSRISTAIW